jgi:hypothetical protein
MEMVMMNDVVDLMAAVIGLRWRFDLTWRMVVFVVFSLSNALGAFTFYTWFDEAVPPTHGTIMSYRWT